MTVTSANGVIEPTIGDSDGVEKNIYPEARDETRTTSVMVGVAPIRVPIAEGGQAPLVHMCLLSR